MVKAQLPNTMLAIAMLAQTVLINTSLVKTMHVSSMLPDTRPEKNMMEVMQVKTTLAPQWLAGDCASSINGGSWVQVY